MTTALLAMVVASATLYAPMVLEEFEQPKSFALIAFACFAAWFVDWRRLKTDRLAQALALFAVSAAASTVLSVDWHMSLWGNPKCPCGLLVIFGYLVFYLAARDVICKRVGAENLFLVLLWVMFAVSVYACLQVAGIDFKQWYGVLNHDGYIRPMSFLGHPNFMAGYLGMALPLALFALQTLKQKRDRIFAAATLLLSVAAIFFSQSRGMWIATAVGVGIYSWISGFRWRWLAYAVAVVGVCLALVPGLRHVAIDRLEHVAELDQARQEYPKAAIRIWQSNPWFGSGTDTFEISFQRQRTPFYWAIERGGSPHKAHNDFLNVLATQGLCGALAALFLTAAVALELWRARGRLFFAPCVASIAAWYIEGLSSFTVIATGCMFLLCVTLLRLE